MWIKALKILSCTICQIIITSLASAETVELRIGKVILGEVRLSGEDEIIVEARFPATKTLRLKYDDLTPISLYRVLERRSDPRNAKERLKLGEFAEESNLNGIAIAEYTTVKQLDDRFAEDMDARIARLKDAIAMDILEDAKDILEEGHPNGALMYLHTLLEQYPETVASKEATTVMERAHEQAGASVEFDLKTVSDDEAPKIIEEINEHLGRGERAVGGHVGSSTQDQRSAKRAVKYYERAWNLAKMLPVAPDDEQLKTHIKELRDRVKKDLVKAYLTTGRVYLQRGAIPDAEGYCNKAGELDPGNKETLLMHRLIIEARIYQ